ncbi:hypothetical protein AV641_03185 [Pseudomonas fragi]|nr:hypothetical protein AV641_03185 [Pseudomonas fragi]
MGQESNAGRSPHPGRGLCRQGITKEEKESTTGLNTATEGLKVETCNMPPALHSCPGLHGFPCSDRVFISLQQSMPMSSIIVMPIVFMGHGSIDA